jgi:hypothetical protein
MSFRLDFAYLMTYDVGAPGITLEVALKTNNRVARVEANIDTGASYSIFNRRVGEELSVQIETGYRQIFSTATGAFEAYGHEATLIVGEIEFDVMVFFGVNKNFNRNVIGRFGGLDHLRIGIVDYEGKLYLSRYDEE